ncbi:MAG: ATP-grasp domain-containing protein [Mesorhizobium sp.]|uniref:ATP-grasp domain-containing protein n=1 Tax=Mesorhizobium sp. TaxID=1871066 RepID=UPI000FE9A75B|nr:acetyl-CoA carboxylase biotin carboxylase subunit family protein [Mesorhizobium sp.]RWH31400.1 MAG: ATP-grasp domain-containing protein [Mesorhizobium sp.]RWH38642.1 MAG: ATP-grasp domain-containing protein [Mesorhizobium sp.]TIM71018.1 MAG: ATP-grasp domain-containing protein [Mesorhizobium sp.]TIO05225.1 MAG: ATP-grasp domain-containing protein [Mesorhizobium sp.]TIR61882.1 MAG: ATP-grasp domain-containing protein [Mesorhizobium sp.]
MARQALILVEGHRTSGLLYVQAAKRLGLHPIALAADPACYDYLAAEQVEAIRVDTDDFDALIRECLGLRGNYHIAGITGFSDFDESIYATVVRLCRHFDLPGPNPVSIERCCDKFVQRQLLAQAGVPTPACRLAVNATDVDGCAAEIGLPVIVKPIVGSGSSGVRLCCNADEIAEHTNYLLGGKHIWRSSPRILVEEFAQGPFYSVEIMGDEVIGIVAADFGAPPHFVFRNTTFPAPLRDDEHKHITDVSLSCLRALGLGWGPTNIEFRWTKRGPVVIEVNPRLAGALEPQLVHLAFGIDLITEHIKLATGEEWDLRRRHSQTAAARFLVPDRDGILDCIEGDNRAAAVPGVVEARLYVESKTPIVRKGDYRDCIGHILAASPSLAQTETILQRAVDLINWSITPLRTLGEEEQSAASPTALRKMP